MRCSCGQIMVLGTIEEWEEGHLLAHYLCPSCHFAVGVKGDAAEVSFMLSTIEWTDEARHVLDRLPPYVEPMVRREIEDYAEDKHVRLVTSSFMIEAKNQGNIGWSPDAKRRLSKVPAPVRAMARVELERTALERGLSEVTVNLMEEIKARYFGMSAQAKSEVMR